MTASQTDVAFSPTPSEPHLDSQEEDPEPDNVSESESGAWHFVQSRVTALRNALQRPVHYFIGDEDSLGEALQAPVTITVPRWALLSIMGLGLTVFWQQERRVWLCRTMSEQHQAGILRLAETFAFSSQNAAAAHAAAARESTQLAVTTAHDHAAGTVVSTLLGMGAAALLLSDQRLKTGIIRLPWSVGGCPAYSWEWSELAKSMFGLDGISHGVLAQDVASLHPEAVRTGSDGFMRVDYMLLLQRL